jgi:hypothetical protein
MGEVRPGETEGGRRLTGVSAGEVVVGDIGIQAHLRADHQDIPKQGQNLVLQGGHKDGNSAVVGLLAAGWAIKTTFFPQAGSIFREETIPPA